MKGKEKEKERKKDSTDSRQWSLVKRERDRKREKERERKKLQNPKRTRVQQLSPGVRRKFFVFQGKERGNFFLFLFVFFFFRISVSMATCSFRGWWSEQDLLVETRTVSMETKPIQGGRRKISYQIIRKKGKKEKKGKKNHFDRNRVSMTTKPGVL